MQNLARSGTVLNQNVWTGRSRAQVKCKPWRALVQMQHSAIIFCSLKLFGIKHRRRLWKLQTVLTAFKADVWWVGKVKETDLTSCSVLSSGDEQRREFVVIIWQQTGNPLHWRTDSREQGVVPGSRRRRPKRLHGTRGFGGGGATDSNLWPCWARLKWEDRSLWNHSHYKCMLILTIHNTCWWSKQNKHEEKEPTI